MLRDFGACIKSHAAMNMSKKFLTIQMWQVRFTTVRVDEVDDGKQPRSTTVTSKVILWN